MTLEEILSRLEGVKGGNGQYSARCPAHDDHNASLSVASGENGEILLYCHKECEFDDIVKALGKMCIRDSHCNKLPTFFLFSAQESPEYELL